MSFRKKFSTLLVVGAIAAVLIAMVLTLWPVEATFEVTMESEIVEVVNTSVFNIDWSLSEAEIIAADGTRFMAYGAEVSIPPKATATIQRVSQGPLLIRLRSKSPGRDAVVVRHPNVPRQGLGDRVVISIANITENASLGQSTILPVVGRVALGKSVAWRSQPVIPISTGGLVAVKGHSFFTQRLYEAGQHQLGLGDEVSFVPDATTAYGFVAANHNPGLMLSFRALASGVAVRRFQGAGYLLRLPMWKRVIKDDIILGVWLTSAFFVSSFVAVRKAFAGED